MARLRKPLIVLGALAAGLGLAELAVRSLDVQPPVMPKRRGQIVREVADVTARFRPVPGGQEWVHYKDSPDGPLRVVTMNVNGQGFRGPEVALEKPADTFRIACLGDSHTFGHGVEDDETWPAHLQRLLDVRFPERRIEVLNCGVNGYDTVQEELWLEAAVLDYAPDLVLLQFYVNDAASRRPDRSSHGVRDFWLDLTAPRRDDWVGTLREVSRFADVVLDGIYRRRGLTLYSAMRSGPYLEGGEGWIAARESIVRMRDTLTERDIAFGFALYPFLVRRGGAMTSRPAFEVVRSFAEGEGIATLDTEPAFDGHDADDLRLSMHDYHGNELAHAIFAGAVADWLEARDWL